MHELLNNINLIVELTAEFPASRNSLVDRSYICLPTLDGIVPSKLAFQTLIRELAIYSGNIYIHCALGHGRSVTLAVALLVAKKLAGNVTEAEAIIKQVRPQIALSKAQRDLLERLG